MKQGKVTGRQGQAGHCETNQERLDSMGRKEVTGSTSSPLLAHRHQEFTCIPVTVPSPVPI